jgi:hypothetical protein
MIPRLTLNGTKVMGKPLKLATLILTVNGAVAIAECREVITANMRIRPNVLSAGTCMGRTGLTCMTGYVPSASEGHQESGIGGLSNTEFSCKTANPRHERQWGHTS